MRRRKLRCGPSEDQEGGAVGLEIAVPGVWNASQQPVCEAMSFQRSKWNSILRSNWGQQLGILAAALKFPTALIFAVMVALLQVQQLLTVDPYFDTGPCKEQPF